MRLTKAEFVHAVQAYQNHMQQLSQVEQATKWTLCESPLFNIANEYYNLLLELCDIPRDGQWNDLDYFVYELDFGAKWHPGCCTDNQGNDIPLSTPEEVYDALCASWGGMKQ